MTGNGLARSAKRAVRRLLRTTGYDLHRVEGKPPSQFELDAQAFEARHRAQTLSEVEALRERYREPVLGVVTVWSVVEMLSRVVDRCDPTLLNVSQEVHVLQMLEAMTDEGADDDMLLAGLLHDLGKAPLDLVGEDPANIGGTNLPIGSYEPGVGLDQCVIQWNHDAFGYSRFAGRVPDHVAWLIRYHSLLVTSCLHLMDDRDRDYYERYWIDFHRWECETKSIDHVPRTRITDYREIVDAAFPEPIPI